MPYSIGSVIEDNGDGTYSIFLNSRQSHEKNIEDLKHELRHIEKGHMEGFIDVQHAEMENHMKDVK